MESTLSLQHLIIAEVYLSSFSCLLNLLLLYILRRYLVFHDHLRSLVFQSQLFVLISNIFIIIRGSSFLLHSPSSSSISSSSSSQGSSIQFCPSQSSPSYFIGLFLIISIAICVERSYASLKYDVYEKWTKQRTLRKTIALFWLISFIFGRLSSLSLSISPMPCLPSLPFSTPVNDSNLPIVIFGVFFLAFSPIFYTNYKKNEETLRMILRQDYSSLSLSSRYQLKENITTCRSFLVLPIPFPLPPFSFPSFSNFFFFFQVQNGTLTVLCLLMLIGKSLMTNEKERSIQREIQYLFYPLAGILISLNFLVLHDSVKRKLWTMYWDSKDELYKQWMNRIHWRKESAEVPLLPT